MAKKQISVLVDEEILMLIDEEAERFERSRNWVINKRLGYFIHTGFDPKWEVLRGGEVWEEPAKKIADISGGGGATEGGGDSCLPRGGKAQLPRELVDLVENVPIVYKARAQGFTDLAVGEGDTCRVGYGDMNAKIADEVLRENGLHSATGWIGGDRDLDPSNPADVAAWQARDRQAAELLRGTTRELGILGPDQKPFTRVPLSENTQFVYDFPNSGKIPGTEVVVPQKNRVESEHDYCECDPQPREWLMTNPPTCGICGGYKNDSAPAASWSDWNKVLDSGEKINPETLAEIKKAAAVDFSLARKVHQKGIELDRDILVRWGLESVDGVEGRAKARKTAGVAGRSAKAVKTGNDVAKSSAVGVGKPNVDMQALRNICAGNLQPLAISGNIPSDLKPLNTPADYGEVDLCGFQSYNEIDGENYVCGKEKHGPKVKHGEWIQV